MRADVTFDREAVVAIGDGGDAFLHPGHLGVVGGWQFCLAMIQDWDLDWVYVDDNYLPRHVWVTVKEQHDDSNYYTLVAEETEGAQPFTMVADWQFWRVP